MPRITKDVAVFSACVAQLCGQKRVFLTSLPYHLSELTRKKANSRKVSEGEIKSTQASVIAYMQNYQHRSRKVLRSLGFIPKFIVIFSLRVE